MPRGKHRTSRSRPVPTPERRDDTERAFERRLGELAEAVNIMIPELSARVAALEHLLVEKGVCRRADLIRARQFVDVRGGGE
ncbi:MAG: hypothetical protein E6J68_02465 [Deltaproteobacteria bacterium]|nr:MAG: hypothetical protein E6J68_02465 [Deltaproteobacteria bacterium]TMB39786.1 MAG: hypothetical protein E6J55_22285 [Deltaproteobacteria bacterium]